jgi:hypothetical protein
VARINELEAEVARLREDAASTRTLASMADRDIAEMRTTMRGPTQVLGALRETQIEQGRALEALSRTVEGIAGAVGGLALGQQRLAERVSGIEEGQTAILARLDPERPQPEHPLCSPTAGGRPAARYGTASERCTRPGRPTPSFRGPPATGRPRSKLSLRNGSAATEKRLRRRQRRRKPPARSAAELPSAVCEFPQLTSQPSQ